MWDTSSDLLSCNTNNIKGAKGEQVSNGCQNWSTEEHL